MNEKSHFGSPHHPRAQWKSRMGFILAAMGSAVGLGNIWRFSYLCYKNGGGAFLIPYAIALVLVGIPLMLLELSIGHKMRGSAPMSFAKISPQWEWAGWWAVTCAMYGIMMYYSTVIAWCLSYVFFSFNLSWGSDPNHFFFHEFLQLSEGPSMLGDIRAPILGALVAVWFLSWAIVFGGVQKGVERANKVFMPLLFSLTLVLVFWSLSLKGAAHGIAVYLKPDLSLLTQPRIWIDAFSQIFFTLSLGFGIMITYASYLPRKVDLVKDACIVSIGNGLYSFIAGFAVFGTLGYMSYSTGEPISEVVKETIGLAFVAYPQTISLMPGFANLFGVLFFTTLVVAGLSSAISLVEAFSSAVVDKFHYPRRTVVSVVCISGFLGSIIFTARSGLYWVDIVDHFVTHYGLVIVGIIQCFLVGWLFRTSRMKEHILNALDDKKNKITAKCLPVWQFCIKVLTPLVLIILLINDLIKEITVPYEGYSWVAVIMIGRDWLLVALIIALIVAGRPWRRDLSQE